MKELKIRKDRTPAVLRQLAKDETDPRVTRRILAIANALSGMNRAEAASSAGMDRQTLRDWVIRYNAHGVAGLVDRWAGGRPPILDERQEVELLEIVLKGPDPVKDGFCAYTRDDLVAIAKKRFGRQVDACDIDGAPAAAARARRPCACPRRRRPAPKAADDFGAGFCTGSSVKPTARPIGIDVKSARGYDTIAFSGRLSSI
jgi:transposase